ncbi:MAG: peptide-methionine (S)-S-oxide reductase MsrA [Candidatus Thorarchaeota archaeon]|jgi:peptide-methionine (S)-S-oxide reductase
MEIATFGAGCFWCVEAVFQQIRGVDSVVSGYAGGHVKNPTYEQVTSGNTDHAEVCQIRFEPETISYEDLVEVFFETHDPTTLNRQGNDIGTQYRSVIFYHNEAQKERAEKIKVKYDKNGFWKNPIVTEVVPFIEFFQAEDYHQNYYRNNPDQAYCRLVISPKLKKFEKVFSLKLTK